MEHEIPSVGKANAALTTGIIGTGLAGLMALNGGNGLLGGLFGGNNGTMNGVATAAALAAEGAACCFVNKDMFYQTVIGQINTQADRDISLERRLAGIESAVAVNSVSNSYQNAAVNQRFETENIINNLNRELAICTAMKDVVRGQTYLSPSMLADSFISPTRVIDSHEAREYLPGRRPFGYGDGCAPCGGHF